MSPNEPIHPTSGMPFAAEGGITKREWFAGMAMQGLLTQAGAFSAAMEHAPDDIGGYISKAAMNVADGMIAALNQERKSPVDTMQIMLSHIQARISLLNTVISSTEDDRLRTAPKAALNELSLMLETLRNANNLARLVNESPCHHPQVIADVCVICGQDLTATNPEIAFEGVKPNLSWLFPFTQSQ